ncbi:MAG: RsmE family RNA methyltransferase [Thermodesulfobacteriota bacterium]|nr:RsmE family RNA methyltransferase [Thermodesulfobacteriota bacterium]
MPRFFCEFTGDHRGFIRGRDAAHIAGPLRMKKGDHIDLRDRSRGYSGVITSLNRQEIQVKVCGGYRLMDRSDKKVHLSISLFNLKEMDTMVRLVSELGVFDIQPVVSVFSNVRDISQKRYQRWEHIIDQGLKLSGARAIPKIQGIVGLEDLLGRSPKYPRYVACMGSDSALTSIRDKELEVLVGPEGGFTLDEGQKIDRAGYIPVHMGRTALSSLSAGVAATGILGM